MSDKLKYTIQWSLYILMMVIVIVTFICLVINIIAPTFFPNKNISGFKDYVNTLCVILSFLSAGLGIYSILQANVSGKQANEMINSIHELKEQQEILLVTLKTTDNLSVVAANNPKGSWLQDNVVK